MNITRAFLKTYLFFFLSALAINVTMELVLSSPGFGIVIFYALFSLAGTAIFRWRRYRPLTMGLLSLVAGYLCEITFMKPDFFQEVLAFRFSARLVLTLAITTFYWFVAWAVPAFLVHRYLFKRGNDSA